MTEKEKCIVKEETVSRFVLPEGAEFRGVEIKNGVVSVLYAETTESMVAEESETMEEKQEDSDEEAGLWTQHRTKVTNGKVTLEVGSEVKGYEANGISEWFVLGAENGKLLITTTRGNDEVELCGGEEYLNGVEILNNAVKDIYNDGNFADTVRSINVEDINRVTGYNLETAGYGKNRIDEYGNEVTYYWTGTRYPYYSASNGVKGELSLNESGFYYPTANGFEKSEISITARRAVKEEITTLTSTFYYYNLKNYLSQSSKAYQMLVGKSFWLGSQYVDCITFFAGFGLRDVDDGYVGGSHLAGSNGGEYYGYYGVLPVVSLKSEIRVNKNGEIFK